jgi:hypothetical protein
MENAGKNDWLASQSLERSLDVISAVNRISIHAKLRLAGIADTTTPDELNSARRSLTAFLGTLSEIIEKAGGTQDKIAFGADPRLGSLARKFLVLPGQPTGAVSYRLEDLKDLKTLLDAGDLADNEALVRSLTYFRAVLEQHAQADAAVVFNEV